MRDVIQIHRTARGQEAGQSLADLRAKAAVCQRIRALFGPGRGRFNEFGGLDVTFTDGTQRHFGPSATATLDALRRQGDVEREMAPVPRERVIIRAPATLAELRVQQKALELDLAFERQRAQRGPGAEDARQRDRAEEELKWVTGRQPSTTRAAG